MEKARNKVIAGDYKGVLLEKNGVKMCIRDRRNEKRRMERCSIPGAFGRVCEKNNFCCAHPNIMLK